MNCGIKEGYGKSYWPNGRLMYDGYFKRDGPDDNGNTVVIYFPNGRVLYEGRMEAGQRVGNGKTYFKNGALEYQGQWLDNMPDGDECVIFGKNGAALYQGRLVRGIGIDSSGNVVYEYGAKVRGE